MTNYDTIIKKHFSEFANSYGFVSKKSWFWYSVHDGFYKAIGFEGKTGKYEPHYFVQPLFDGICDYIILEYGNYIPALWDKSKTDSRSLLLFKGYEEEQFVNNLEAVKKYMADKVLPTLEKITDVNSLINVLNGRFFCCSEFNRMRLRAYSTLYSGKYEEAYHLFKEYIEVEKAFPQPSKTRISEPELLLELIERNPEEAHSILKDNITKTIAALKLKADF